MKKKAKILFIYPNERHMSTIPPSIALFSQLLKKEGHSVALFDTTFYELDDEIKLKGSDESKVDRLTIRPDERHYRKDTKVEDTNGKKTLTVKLNPILEKDDDVLHFEYIKDNPSVDLRNKIKEFKPDLLAVTCTETTFPRGLKLIKDTRDMGIPNVFGGVFPTFAPQVCMDIKEIDMCCVGEGEKALINLTNLIAEGKDYYDVTNLWIRLPDGSIKKNGVTDPVDINTLPPVTDIGLFDKKRFYRPMGGKIRRLLPVETHRGCPYPCSFCNSPSQNRLYEAQTSKPFFRKKKMSIVKQEIEEHVKKWKVNYIAFWADTFLAWNNKEFEEFCEMYSEFKIPFWCNTRIETISEYKLKKLKDVGLNRISFGFEHGNEKFRREVVRRNYTNELAVRLMKIPAQLDIDYSVNNIIGFPGETRELAFDTIEVNRQFEGCDSFTCSVLVPFHGTEIRQIAEKAGYIDPKQIVSVSNGSASSTLNMPQWRQQDIQNLAKVFTMYIKFPKSRWPEIKKAETDENIYRKLHAEFVDTFWSTDKNPMSKEVTEAAKGLFA